MSVSNPTSLGHITAVQPRPQLHIDIPALLENFTTLTRLAGKAEVACVVKADAYGLGADMLAPHLYKAGARTFYVASLEEGISLRQALTAYDPNSPAQIEIVVFSGYWPQQAEALKRHGLTPVLNSPEQWLAFQKDGGGPAALFIDTGMNRLGFSPYDVQALIASPASFETIKLTRIISHMACADEPSHPQNAAQHNLFTELTSQLPQAKLSLANTAATLLGADYHFDEVRPGVGLYGASPVGTTDHPFKPVVRIRAPILQLRPLGPNQAVGYGAHYVTDKPRLAATIALGYADGLLRSSSPGGYGRIQGQAVPFMGRISMDFSVVDVTGLNVQIGDHVEILGADIDQLAHKAGTIGYEYLTRLGTRLERLYT